MKTLIFEHKPERLTVYQVTINDATDIAKAIGSYYYTVNHSLEHGTAILEFKFKDRSTSSLVLNADDYIGVKENDEIVIFTSLDTIGEHYRKAKKTV